MDNIIIMNWYKKTLDKTKKSVIIAQMKKEFIIMRGLPGSGKSTLAEQLAGEAGQIFSADKFFIGDDGIYRWDRDKLSESHRWNYGRAAEAMNKGASPVVLDNTNVSKYDLRALKPIVQHAQRLGYNVRIEQPDTPWAFNQKELETRNTHGVPPEDIERMMRKWVKDPTVDEILDDFQARGSRNIGV